MIYQQTIINEIRKAMRQGKTLEDFKNECKYQRFSKYFESMWNNELERLEKFKKASRIKDESYLRDAWARFKFEVDQFKKHYNASDSDINTILRYDIFHKEDEE